MLHYNIWSSGEILKVIIIKILQNKSKVIISDDLSLIIARAKSIKQDTKPSLSPPSKITLQRKVQHSPKKVSVQNNKAFNVVVIRIKQGISLAYVLSNHDDAVAGYINPIISKCELDQEIKTSMKIDEIMFRRSESNERTANKPGSLYGLYQFVTVFESED